MAKQPRAAPRSAANAFDPSRGHLYIWGPPGYAGSIAAFHQINWTTTQRLMPIIERETRARLPRHLAGNKATRDEPLDTLLLDDDTGRTTGPLPRPEMVDAKSRIIWPYIIAITLFH